MSNDNTLNQAQSQQQTNNINSPPSGTGFSTAAGKVPSLDKSSGGFVQGTPIDPDTARSIIENRPLPLDIVTLSQSNAHAFAAGAASGTISGPASIVELARGLKNDPDLIFEYCATQIDFLTSFGLHKGGLGASLDGRGSAYDIADLMVQLLRQSGYTANYVNGELRLTLAQAAAWFGTSTTDIYAARNLLANGGIPAAINNVAGIDYLDFTHCWVQVTIGATTYVFDPAFKVYTVNAGIANLATAMGYNAATYLTRAKTGATTTADYVQNMNRSNIRADLTTMTTNLVNWIKANNPAATVDDIVGGRTINPITLGSRVTSLSYQKPGSTPTVWTAIPASYKATLGILYDTFNLTLFSADIYGKRLTMFFNASHQCELRLDGTILATSSAQAVGSWNSVLLTATHPYPSTFADQSRWLRIYADQFYAIANGWGNAAPVLRDLHTNRFYINQASGGAATSEPVLGEEFVAFYAAQNAENSRATDLINKMTNCVTVFHHQLGLVGDVGAPFIDVAMFVGASSALDNNYNRVQWNDTAGAMHGVTFEATSMQENLGPVGVSTVTIIDLASQAGKKIFDAKTANWLTSVKPNLVGWDPSIVSDIENYYVNAGWRVTLPENGVTTLNLFSGYGYWALPTYGAFGILGGTKGALGSNVRSAVPPPIPVDNIAAGASGLTFKNGNFSLQSVDFSTGSQDNPYSVNFSRSYNAANSYVDKGLGLGWDHNLAITATIGNSTLLTLGDKSPLSGAAAIVELFVIADLLSDLSRPHDKFVTASLGCQWLADNVVNNIVNIQDASGTTQFVKLPDGSYINAFGIAETLTLSAGLYTYKSAQKTIYNFNSVGNIATVVFPFGVTHTFTYTAGKLTSVSNGLGRTINLVYTGNKLSSINDGTGRSVSFTLDANNNLTAVTDPLGKNKTYSYVTPGVIFKAFNPANPTSPLFTNTYDSVGQLKQQTDAYANITTMFYAGYRTEVVNAAGKKSVVYLNRFGDCTKHVDHQGNTNTWNFDGRRRVTAQTLPEGNGQAFLYDGNNNITSITAVKKPGSPLANITVTRTYDPLWNKVKTAVDSLGRTTTYNYNATTGNLESVVHPTLTGGGTPQLVLTYNARGQVLTSTDPTGVVTKYTYDTVTEKLTSIVVDFGVGRLNLTTNFTYNAAGDVISIQDPRGNTLVMQYDLNRRQTQRTMPAPFSYVEKITYDDNGNAIKKEKQTNIVANPWQTFEATYAIDSKLLTLKSPSGFITQYSYTNLRQLWKTTDPLSRVTEYTYDDLGRVFTITDPSLVIDSTRLYSPNGQLLSIKDSRNNITSYTYDGLDRPLRRIFPNSTYSEIQSYDTNSNALVVRTRGANTLTMTYDELNRLKTKAASGQPTVTYAYDLANRLLSASKPIVAGDPSAGTFSTSYDTAGRLAYEQYPDGKQFVHQLDANGNITRTTWPDGWYCERVFDKLNQLTDIKLNGATTSAVQYQYDALSRRVKVILENGTTTDYTSELDNDLQTLAHTFVGSSVSWTYGYNNASELSSKQVSDSNYNWHPSTAGSLVYGTASNINTYPTIGAVSYSFNNDGCVTGDGTWTYTYSSENRLLTANKTGTSLSFKYDAHGRQVEKAVGAVKTRFYYSGMRRFGDYDSSGVLQNRYVYAPNTDEVAIRVSSAGVKTYYHADNLGSVIATTNSAGNLVNSYKYGPFGETAALPGINNGYTGQRYDSESDLYFYKSRYYSPSLGRFLQPDVAGYAAGLNLYAYVGNNPTNTNDPFGFDGAKNPIPTSELGWNWIRENMQGDYNFFEWFGRIFFGGDWDVKTGYVYGSGPEYDYREAQGNINFAATGRKIGIPTVVLHIGAGIAQITAQVLRNLWAAPGNLIRIGTFQKPVWKTTFEWQWIFTSLGDDPEDFKDIDTGAWFAAVSGFVKPQTSLNATPNSLPPGGGGGGGGGGGPSSSGPSGGGGSGGSSGGTTGNVGGTINSSQAQGQVKNYGKTRDELSDMAKAKGLDPLSTISGQILNPNGSVGTN